MKVDVYEPPTIKDYLEERGHVLEALPYGDYWIETEHCFVAIQRKKAADLMNSIMDGRLADDMKECIREADIALLLLEGSWSFDRSWRVKVGRRRYPLSATEVERAIVDLIHYGAGILPHMASNPLTTAHLLDKLSQDFGDPSWVSEFLRRGRHRKPLYDTLRPSEQALVDLRVGFGPKTAPAILGDRTFREFLQLSDEELLALPAIGAGTLEKLHRVLDE